MNSIKCKCICLSGTPVNTIWKELNYILFIFNDKWDIECQDKNKIIKEL